MPDNDIHAMLRRLDTMERNQSDLAKSVTEMVSDLNELRRPIDDLRIDREVRKERDIRQTERFDRIEVRLDGISKLGWWVLTTFGALTMAAIANLLFGGPHAP
jgi:hypothetical protein